MPLNEQVILITGAAGGLGRTAAKALSASGATIILLDKNVPKLEEVYDELVKSNEAEPVIYPFDLAGANENQYEDLAGTIAEKYGALQGLLYSAVEFSAFTPISIHGTAAWGHTLNVNLNAAFILTRVLLPVMQKSKHASIVFTSDSASRLGKAYSGAYGVSKIALEGFARILADELESSGKIRVNTLVPGPVNSPLRRRAYPAEDKHKLPDMASLNTVYNYLFADQSIGLTGQIIDAQTFTPKRMNYV